MEIDMEHYYCSFVLLILGIASYVISFNKSKKESEIINHIITMMQLCQ